MRRLLPLATAALLVSAACSTYQRITPLTAAGAGGTARVVGGQAAGQNAAGVVATGQSGAAGQLGVTGAGATASGGGSSAAGIAGGGSAVGASTDAGGAQVTFPSSATASAPGRTACTVKVGVTYSSDVNAALAGAGDPGQAANYGNYVAALQAEYQAGADHINSTGGLGGCKMTLAYYDFRSLSADGFDAESQRECTSLAQDQHVAMAFIYGLETRTVIDCMARFKIPVFYHGGEYTVPNDRDYTQYRGYLYQETGFSTDRWGPFIDALAQHGYFDKGSKVGILLADDGNGNNQHLVNDIWKPRLAALGYPNPKVFTFTQLKSYSSIGDTQSQFSSAVLQFKLAGIDHIIGTPDSGNETLFFPQQAESQDYHPRYAFTSVNYPELMKNVPADQSVGAMSVSFLAQDAENAGQMATNYPNAARSACDALFKGKTNGGPAPYLYCDFINVVTTALRGAHGVTPASLLAGIEGLGTSIIGTGDYGGTRFGSGRYDGGTAVRVMEWDPTIKDFRYITGGLTIP